MEIPVHLVKPVRINQLGSLFVTEQDSDLYLGTVLCGPGTVQAVVIQAPTLMGAGFALHTYCRDNGFEIFNPDDEEMLNSFTDW